MKLVSRFFDELTTAELYEILRTRSEIFVVEQNCVYPFLSNIITHMRMSTARTGRFFLRQIIS